MSAKYDRDRKMLNSEDAIERARPLLDAMVDRIWRQTGSRMSAYEQVAAMTGVSSSWIRKVLGGYSGASIKGHSLLNIAHAYSRLCERVDADAAQRRQRAQEMRNEANEILSKFYELDQLAPRGVEGVSVPSAGAARQEIDGGIK